MSFFLAVGLREFPVLPAMVAPVEVRQKCSRASPSQDAEQGVLEEVFSEDLVAEEDVRSRAYR